MSESLSKPRLPRELMRVSALGSSCFIAYALTLYIAPSAVAWVLWNTEAPAPLRIAGVLVLVMLSGQGLHLLGWVGHEGFHFNLSRNKTLSALLGVFFSSMIVSFFTVGANVSHWDHHRYTNQKGDPDCDIFAPHKTFLSRLFVARLKLNRTHLLNTLKLAVGSALPWKHPPFEMGRMGWYARLNLACSFGWLALYIAIGHENLALALVCIASPHVATFVFTGLRSYVEHAGTRVGTYVDSRTRSSVVSSILYFFNNYHLEHHLYPGIPCYRLPAVHAHLRSLGVFDGVEGVAVDPALTAEMRYSSSAYVYPHAE